MMSKRIKFIKSELKNFKNEKIGVIGKTGIGKSTFIDLLTEC